MARASHEVVEAWTPGLVGRYHLSVHDGVVDVELGRQLSAEFAKPAQGIVIARDEAAVALLEIAQGTKAVVSDLEELDGIVERLLSRTRDNRLYTRQCHLQRIAQAAASDANSVT